VAELKTIEVIPVQPVPAGVDWVNIGLNGVKDGAWAVLLAGVITYSALRGVVGKYLDKHMTLLDTMKDALSKNANSLEDLSKSEIAQYASLVKQTDAIERQGEAISGQQNAIINMDARHKEVVTRSFELLTDNSAALVDLSETNLNQTQQHVLIAKSLEDLKRISDEHQQEVLSKLQTIEDLYHASEDITKNNITPKNFWRR